MCENRALRGYLRRELPFEFLFWFVWERRLVFISSEFSSNLLLVDCIHYGFAWFLVSTLHSINLGEHSHGAPRINNYSRRRRRPEGPLLEPWCNTSQEIRDASSADALRVLTFCLSKRVSYCFSTSKRSTVQKSRDLQSSRFASTVQ